MSWRLSWVVKSALQADAIVEQHCLFCAVQETAPSMFVVSPFVIPSTSHVLLAG